MIMNKFFAPEAGSQKYWACKQIVNGRRAMGEAGRLASNHLVRHTRLVSSARHHLDLVGSSLAAHLALDN